MKNERFPSEKKIWKKFVSHFISQNFKILVSENVDFSSRQAGRKISMSESQRAPSKMEKGKLLLFSAIDSPKSLVGQISQLI